MENELLLPWWNYRTKTYDYFAGLPDDPRDYIPQNPAAQNEYILLAEHSTLTKEQIMIRILEVCAGEKPSVEVKWKE